MLGEFDELAYDRYRAALVVHGDLGVEFEDFRRHLLQIAARHLPPEKLDTEVAAFVQRLHTTDIILSLACARGSEEAWSRFGGLYRKYLADVSRHLLGRSADPENVCEALWIDLFLPDRSGHSRIASYDGRSSLATWLRVVVSNRIINERQRKTFRASNLDGIPEPADPAALHNVEAGLGRDRYEPMILKSFDRASSELTARERLLVLLRYDEGLQLGEIAKLFSVHQSTVTRQLERTFARLREHVVSLLATEYGLDPTAIEECLSVASETFSASGSILALLRDAPTPVHDPQSAASAGGGASGQREP